MQRFNLYTLLTQVASGIALFVASAGAMWAFITYYHFSLVGAIAAAVIGLVPGLFMLLITEGLYVLLQILKEKRHQSKLLSDIKESLESKPATPDADHEIVSDH